MSVPQEYNDLLALCDLVKMGDDAAGRSDRSAALHEATLAHGKQRWIESFFGSPMWETDPQGWRYFVGDATKMLKQMLTDTSYGMSGLSGLSADLDLQAQTQALLESAKAKLPHVTDPRFKQEIVALINRLDTIETRVSDADFPGMADAQDELAKINQQIDGMVLVSPLSVDNLSAEATIWMTTGAVALGAFFLYLVMRKKK